MLKICMIVHKEYAQDPRVKRYAEALADAGHRVDVLCTRGGQAPDYTRIRTFAIPIRHGADSRLGLLAEYLMAYTLFSFWLLGLYVRNRYDVIHIHNMPDFLVFTALMPRLGGSQLILDIHDPMPEFYTAKFGQGPATRIARTLMSLEERLSVLFVHAVITANDYFRANLIKRGVPAEKITVINNVPDPKVFNRDDPALVGENARSHFSLIYPGTIAPRYGLDVAIRAMPLLISRIPNIQLIIIGSLGEYGETLKALAGQLNVSQYVRFAGQVRIDEVVQYLHRSDIGIYPALPDAHMSIATPSKVLEYAVMGIPVVSSRVQVLEDLFTDAAIMFFEPGNVTQFADCVYELFRNPGRRHELVCNADRIFVRTHSWTNEPGEYFQLLARLVRTKESVVGGDYCE